LQYFLVAAEMGHTDACHKIGWLYNSSETVSQNVDKAIYRYEKASGFWNSSYFTRKFKKIMDMLSID